MYSFLAIACVLFLISCENSDFNADNNEDLIDAATLSEQIKDVIIEPVTEDLEGDYKISIRFKESLETDRMPDVFKLCGFSDIEPLSKTVDRPFLYSSITGSQKIREMYLNSITNEADGAKAKGWKFICEFSLTSPGQYDKYCKKTCSSESILGGNTWFCVCIHKCEIGYE